MRHNIVTVHTSTLEVSHTNTHTHSLTHSQYQDAQESPLEQCITDSMVKSKESNSISTNVSNLFSLVPSGVATYKSTQPIMEEAEPVINPDSFGDFFRLLCKKRERERERAVNTYV